ncbi:MAG: hypothetical protein JEZ01_20465 [Labilibaculum sp.]|nr:hypothetical protein [Labilibaculum sp.]MBI9060153.1 hypothetical protein [Labilibaculum sp.]
MTTIDIINLLRERELEFVNTKTFSKLPGIYALFFIGDSFPILGNGVKKHEIIYIGKTESSQEKRDAKTHFADGKTGSSTVRKSIGSLLHKSKKLNPIPRNLSDYEKGRVSMFKFDKASEEVITDWMKNNLALSFYEYSKSSYEIEELETELIAELKPILNIAKNPNNLFKNPLANLRKECATIAFKKYSPAIIQEGKILQNKKQGVSGMKSSGIYVELWRNQRNQITNCLKDASITKSLQLKSNDFNSIGNRKSYSFNLEFKNGIVSNNIGGSAVARDLAYVLEKSADVKAIIKSGHYKINMNSSFQLNIIKLK